ncbi:RHS repeat-associated core domain-containing protein [Dysgonomonas sp. PFB1-18]|nr:RHS repeat-associated core domain-containing protein [Dysgonomonas sp. PFB1-18]
MDIKSPVAEARNEYVYSAGGQKLKVVQKWNSSYSTSPVVGSTINVAALDMTKTTDYVGNNIYENGTLKRILTDEGYYDIGKSTYYFYFRDHLGNVRAVTDANRVLEQRNNYYPFGMSFADNYDKGSKQPYKYNGKELDQMHRLDWYDYSARYYEPSIGRFTTVDPLAEKYYSWSPYNYVGNNPIRFVDFKGDSISVPQQNQAQFTSDLNTVFGNHTQNFSYTSTGMLVYSGSTRGMTRDQKTALKGLTKVMNESTITNIIYGTSTQVTDNNGNTETVNASDGGGALTLLASENPNLNLNGQNTILIDPSMGTSMTVQAVPLLII